MWVPFELGRPLGVPNNPEFQKRLLVKALTLLEMESGPVLEDFPEEAPISDTKSEILACPVIFSAEKKPLIGLEEKCSAFKREVMSFKPWYDLAVKKRNRTTVGVSGLDFDVIPDFICAFFHGDLPENPNKNLALHYTLNLAVDDLKAFYYESMSAQPGQDSLSAHNLDNWFWNETMAGDMLFDLRSVCKKSEDLFIKMVGNALLVPTEQLMKRKS